MRKYLNGYDEIKKLSGESFYKNCIKKLLNAPVELSKNEKEFLLSFALLLLKYYDEDKRRETYLEYAYFIILNYSLKMKDYIPLFDFSVNFGYYPIAHAIINDKLLPEDKVSFFNYLVDCEIESKYQKNGFVNTLEQQKKSESLLQNNSNNIAYIAPTSFGKSSVIIEHIKKNISEYNHFCVVVPSKSLILQTFQNLKKQDFECKIIMHDEMYEGEAKFIAVLTQERAIRMISKKHVCFDVLYIDEAQNILERDPRSILLARLIKWNYDLNPNCKVLYFSPLVSKAENLNILRSNPIVENKIHFNIKEPSYFFFSKKSELQVYNRYLDTFFDIEQLSCDYLDFINRKKKEKNFCFLNTPRKIEKFAKKIARKKESVDSHEINQVILDVQEYVHEDFWGIDCLKKGMVYLHGKMPDRLKDYLELKFKKIKQLDFIIANTVILEGINLPIDNLFILTTWGLDSKDLTNLIGRVNRLDCVFGEPSRLDKLVPEIYFVDSDEFGVSCSTPKSKIESLKSNLFRDELKNPLLNDFDINATCNKAERERVKIERIQKENGVFFCGDSSDSSLLLQRNFLITGLSKLYNDVFDYSVIQERLQDKSLEYRDIIDLIYKIFINELEDDIIDNDFRRLQFESSRNFYSKFIENRKKSLKERINWFFSYFQHKKTSDPVYYVGESYGEIKKRDSDKFSLYVDLSSKSNKELINLAIVRIKIEEDFISYTLNPFVQILHDYHVVNEQDYNEFIYGTNDPKIMKFEKMGLTIDVINRIEQDGQLQNISINEHNMFEVDEKFKEYKNQQHGIYRFELDKWF